MGAIKITKVTDYIGGYDIFLAMGNLDMKSGFYQSQGASLAIGMLSPSLLGTWSKAH